MSIGKKHNKSSAQVALRFNAQRGVVVIPKSFSRERIQHNFQVKKKYFPLNDKECVRVEMLAWNIFLVQEEHF